MSTLYNDRKTADDRKIEDVRRSDLPGEPSPWKENLPGEPSPWKKPLEEAELEVVVFDSSVDFDAMTFS